LKRALAMRKEMRRRKRRMKIPKRSRQRCS
jgi:hypothetical protein